MSIADVIVNATSLVELFKIRMLSVNISPPKPKLTQIQIPGTSDVIDLSESISGDIEYDQRDLTVVFEYVGAKESFHAMHSKISNFLHGRKMQIVFSQDSGFYFLGRLSVDSYKWEVYGGTLTLSATVDPYKYETQSSLEPWLWDSFSFEDGIIRDYFDIAVPGTVTIIGRRKRVCPKIICSGAMTVAYLGNTYNLATGENIIPDIFLGDGEHVLTFTGTGTVDIDYRGASL